MKSLFALFLLTLFLGGCGFLKRAEETATTPDPVTEETPIETVVEGAVEVAAGKVASGILKITTGIAVIILGGLGYSIRQGQKAQKRLDQVNLEVQGLKKT